MQLYERNSDKKFYRFRKPNQYEIDAIKEAKIYLCRPRVYEDSGDCKWIDDIESLVKYVISIKETEKYKSFKNQLTSLKYTEIVQNIKNSPKYKNFTEKVCNLCLVSCITDKMTNYMWEEYANNGEGVCLEFNFEDVIIAVKKLGFHFFQFVMSMTENSKRIFNLVQRSMMRMPRMSLCIGNIFYLV